jgi:hypothetical protein
MDQKNLKVIKWTTRIVALIIIVGGLPFYFGYGNPLPFINQEYTFYDNLWLIAFPLMFIGLALGLKYEKVGGYLLMISLLIGIFTLVMAGKGSGMQMVASLFVGALYLIVGYKKQS